MNYLPKVTRNTLTLFVNRSVVTVINFVVGIYVIRYLGAKLLGEYSVVFAFLAFFSVFTTGSGMDQILVREVSRGGAETDIRRKITTTVFFRLILGGVGFLIAIGSSRFLYAESPIAIYILISSFSLLFSFHENNSPFIVDYNTRLELFLPQVLMTLISLASALLKLLFVFGVRASLLWFILLDAWIPLVISIAYWILYRRTLGKRFCWEDYSWQEGKNIIKESFPLLLSSFFMLIYLRIDQIMISKWLGDEALGNYSVAVRITEIFNFVPAYLAVSLLPVFTKTLHDRNREDVYEFAFRFLNMFIFPVILFFSLFPREIVDLLFHSQFPVASNALQVLIWSEFAVFAGCIYFTILLANGLQKYNLLLFMVQAIANLSLNWFLIGRMSIVGASWACVISYCIQLLASLFIPGLRKYMVILLRCSFPFAVISLTISGVAAFFPWLSKIFLGVLGVFLLLIAGMKRKDIVLAGNIWNEIKLIGKRE
jgi:PST family polysaccharide transporter